MSYITKIVASLVAGLASYLVSKGYISPELAEGWQAGTVDLILGIAGALLGFLSIRKVYK